MKHIQIRTGNGLRPRLASTVNIGNLFTELIKNSLQNNATNVWIHYNKQHVKVIDDGTGFDDVKDTTGLNDFEKYFVYGESYTKSDKHLNLGQMGIGGKAANDRLSDINNTHWSIGTINKHNRCYIMTFKSSNEKYLVQIHPTVRQTSRQECGIHTATGTVITIHNLNQQLLESGFPDNVIKNNIQQFFNMLYFQTKKQNRTFNIRVNGELIKFDNKLPGKPWLNETRTIHYKMSGQQHSCTYDIRLNTIREQQIHPILNCVDLISYTRICKYMLNPQYLSKPIQSEYFTWEDVFHFWESNIRGYIICDALSDVRDANGMAAKDLTHHNLDNDHPITKALHVDINNIMCNKISTILKHEHDPDTYAHEVLNHVTHTISNNFNIPNKFMTDY